VESAPRAYRLKASNAAPPSSTFPGAIPAPQYRIVKREIAQDVVKAAEGFEGALAVRVEDKRQGPPKLHDLPSLQKLCSSRFGWAASKTLEVAQELYDGQSHRFRFE